MKVEYFTHKTGVCNGCWQGTMRFISRRVAKCRHCERIHHRENGEYDKVLGRFIVRRT